MITTSDFDYASTWEFNLIYHPRELEYVKKPELIVTTRNFVFFFLMMNWHTNTNIQFESIIPDLPKTKCIVAHSGKFMYVMFHSDPTCPN